MENLANADISKDFKINANISTPFSTINKSRFILDYPKDEIQNEDELNSVEIFCNDYDHALLDKPKEKLE